MRRLLPVLLLALVVGGLPACGGGGISELFDGRSSQPPPAGPGGDWLDVLNAYRSWADLPPVVHDDSLTFGLAAHSRYMVINDFIGHYEDPGEPGYTPEGDEAAQHSNLHVNTNSGTSYQVPMASWMTGPFHGIGMIDPRLTASAFADYAENTGFFQYGASLDVLTHRGGLPPGTTFPIFWPADGKTVVLDSYDGSESPDPLASCPGYSAPTGLPVYLQLGGGSLVPIVTASSFSSGGMPLEHCVFDETTYANGDPAQQSLGRAVLDARDAVVLIPRDPLVPGATYDVSLTVNALTYTWSFTVDPTAMKPASPGLTATR